MARHALAPYYCNRTSTVRPDHTPRDDKGKAGRTKKLPSHRYKTLVSAIVGSTPVKADPRRTPQRSTSLPPDRSHNREPERFSESTDEPLPRCHAYPARARCRFLRFNQLGEGTALPSQSEARRGPKRLCQIQGGSQGDHQRRIPFAPEILDKPIPSSFRLPTLEPYDGSTDMTEHVAAFRAQMALYDTSGALMCRIFPMTLCGSARMWYSQLKPSFISSFDQLAKEFELNFIASSCPRPTAASLLSLTQGSDKPLAQFVSRFSAELRRMPNTHHTLAIQSFLMGLRPSQFFWSLIERTGHWSTVPEMLQWASQYVVAETLVAGKREDHKKS
ncbi:hypothetical protein BHE74_00000396 [Ensete ventricosum]|nr:hypothetical protein BHE74_00000396 [Ensete ventricosum]